MESTFEAHRTSPSRTEKRERTGRLSNLWPRSKRSWCSRTGAPSRQCRIHGPLRHSVHSVTNEIDVYPRYRYKRLAFRGQVYFCCDRIPARCRSAPIRRKQAVELTLNIRDALVQDALQHFWILQLLVNLSDNGLSEFLLLSLLDLSLVSNP